MSWYKGYEITTFATYHFRHIACLSGNSWFFCSGCRKGPPQLSNVVQMQIIGMREAGMSLRQIAQHVGHHHSTVSRIVNKHRLTNDVKDRPQSVRSRITPRREDNVLGRLVRWNLFANSTVLKKQWLPHRLLSARTVRNRLKSVVYHSRRPVKRCLLTQAHKAFQLQWCQTRRQWNLAS